VISCAGPLAQPSSIASAAAANAAIAIASPFSRSHRPRAAVPHSEF